MLMQCLGGTPFSAIARQAEMSEHRVRVTVGLYVRHVWDAFEKLRRAEVACRALAMEVRLLRLGKEAPRDEPIEKIGPPEQYLKQFRAAGILTVNQLRAVDRETLLSRYRFPAGAIDWGILTLDRMKLSHSLVSKRRPGRHVVVVANRKWLVKDK
jgi:hypothetical protein